MAVNLGRLEDVVREMAEFTDTSGIIITSSDPRYDQLTRGYADLARGLPPIDGYRVDARPMSMADIGQWRIDAIDVPESLGGLHEAIEAPGVAVSEYRHRPARPSLARASTRRGAH